MFCVRACVQGIHADFAAKWDDFSRCKAQPGNQAMGGVRCPFQCDWKGALCKARVSKWQP